MNTFQNYTILLKTFDKSDRNKLLSYNSFVNFLSNGNKTVSAVLTEIFYRNATFKHFAIDDQRLADTLNLSKRSISSAKSYIKSHLYNVVKVFISKNRTNYSTLGAMEQLIHCFLSIMHGRNIDYQSIDQATATLILNSKNLFRGLVKDQEQFNSVVDELQSIFQIDNTTKCKSQKKLLNKEVRKHCEPDTQTLRFSSAKIACQYISKINKYIYLSMCVAKKQNLVQAQQIQSTLIRLASLSSTHTSPKSYVSRSRGNVQAFDQGIEQINSEMQAMQLQIQQLVATVQQLAKDNAMLKQQNIEIKQQVQQLENKPQVYKAPQVQRLHTAKPIPSISTTDKLVASVDEINLGDIKTATHAKIKDWIQYLSKYFKNKLKFFNLHKFTQDMHKANQNGYTVDDCIDEAMSHGWANCFYADRHLTKTPASSRIYKSADELMEERLQKQRNNGTLVNMDDYMRNLFNQKPIQATA